MNKRHFRSWPDGLVHSLAIPQTSLYSNLEVTARRHPELVATNFYGSLLSYQRLDADVLCLAGFLQARCGVQKGDRVLLCMQNSPQFVIGYYAILRADAIVVPVSPMLKTAELAFLIGDCAPKAAIVSQEVFPQLASLVGASALTNAIVATYSDYLNTATDLQVPDFVRAPRQVAAQAGVTPWATALEAGHAPRAHQARPDDTAILPYTSGTTGRPKACVHSHRTTMYGAVVKAAWGGAGHPGQVILACLPFFHVTGMQLSMNTSVYCGGTLVILPRWDRDAAGALIERFGVTEWINVPTMAIDFLANPRLSDYNLDSLSVVGGGGAPMPAAIGQRLLDLVGRPYAEGYGLSETIGATHMNSPRLTKPQCLGIPIFDIDSRVVDLESGRELAVGELGEIVIHGPPVFSGYWNDPAATRDAFVELDGKRFFRTGDLGHVDDDGFFFCTDRLKRMINASGLKVWPAEVESFLMGHPALQQCCVIGAADAYRGETVKALVVLKAGAELAEQGLIDWLRDRLAAYKVPSRVEFVPGLPIGPTGKVQWRELQARERQGR